eukprot:gnl/TRDRNA2_/TRDRNA2_210127_c0_seq1.p2 gnl/TRDRNA2_/TRDRNA2_210127_c0~~gnl/TRDRNA2_/TRDRNA2_210127_c0_seq1.p2  ORF type:complete len:129 (+),score=1.10 gnl/TRDRNA2_/TRDRNA2_210127_c0_seq1:273-659(+)
MVAVVPAARPCELGGPSLHSTSASGRGAVHMCQFTLQWRALARHANNGLSPEPTSCKATSATDTKAQDIPEAILGPSSSYRSSASRLPAPSCRPSLLSKSLLRLLWSVMVVVVGGWRKRSRAEAPPAP